MSASCWSCNPVGRKKMETRKHGAGEPSKRGAGGQMHARSERPSVASGVAKRVAMAGGVSSVDGHGDGGGIFLVLTLPYLTFIYTLP